MAEKYMKTIKFETDGDIYHPLPVLIEGGKDWVAAGPTASAYRPVHYFNGLTIFGDASAGGLYYSDDDCATSTQSNYTSTPPSSLMEVNGMLFFTVSSGLYYSEDGETWTKTSITSGIVRGICYGNSLWIAATSSGIYYSEDGKTWTLGNSSSSFTSVGFNGFDLFVAGGATNVGIYYSSDGKTWIKSSSLTDDLKTSHICYGNGLWVATRDYQSTDMPGIWYSTDGKTWTKSSTNLNAMESYFLLKFANGVWLAGGGSFDSYYSTDGKTWSKISVELIDFAFANGLWVGYEHLDTSAFKQKVYTSTDGINWKLVDTVTNTSGILAMYVGDRLILTTYGGTSCKAVRYSENPNYDNHILMVQNGEWAMVAVPNAEEVAY